ncbi:hypothetical protein CONLIGDRAFT_262412 [Coniochaeta ligniaria NRRL 30616]|uniref:DnaJ homolog 1, mitochondrial n=1 Tax=Coniochaeta ligniaria NRRL 30616 TaxID=1408157 RepID=A0A1J7JSA1_9PEZI|nr:hypothetical protein CONLIGDRAFT_262412 [Coniochaeta ligniaria NRRL 30616]
MNSSLLPKAALPVRTLSPAQICRHQRIKRCAGRSAAPICTFTVTSRPAHHPSPRTAPSVIQKRSFHATGRSQASQKDPYSVLGVDKGATPSDIKKAYYGLAKKFHPDTNKDPSSKDKFAEIQSAYEILSDPKKKEQFDQFGAAGFDPSGGMGGAGADPFGGGHPFSGFGGQGGGFGGGFNFEDLFSAFTGQHAGRGGRGGARNPFQQEILVGDNIEVQTTISFMDAAKGTNKKITITPLVQCKTCTGSGVKSGATKVQCKACGGTGTRVHFMQGGFQMASTCGTCSGTGQTVPKGSECGSCRGEGVVREKTTLNIEIPAGIENGMRLRVDGAGDAPATGRIPDAANARTGRGDLFLHVNVEADPKFSRQGSDILYTAAIPFTTALLGGEVTIPTLDGDVKVKVNTGTGTGDKMTLAGKGMKKLNARRGGFGDLRVEFRVNMPKSLSANQRTLAEMLADELGDKTARRVMNVKKPTSDNATTTEGESHGNEGFLKSLWHNITNHPAHQKKPEDDTKPKDGKTDDKPKSEDEPKKNSGSGSG